LLVTTFLTLILNVFSLQGKCASNPAGNSKPAGKSKPALISFTAPPDRMKIPYFYRPQKGSVGLQNRTKHCSKLEEYNYSGTD
jgi:hypothetical protein